MLQKLQSLIGCVFIYNWQARVYAFLILIAIVLTTTVSGYIADDKRGVTIESVTYAASKEVSTSTSEIVNPNSIVKYGTKEEALLNAQILYPVKTGDKFVDEKVEEIFSEILTDDMSNYEKVVAVYNYVETSFTYSSSFINPSCSYVSDYDAKMVGRAKGILKTGHGTCTEFSAAYMVMMRALGFDCYCIQGSFGSGSHTWTIIILGEDKYIFDPQIDFRNWQRGGCNNYSYDHFCLSYKDGECGKYHAYNEFDNIWSFNNFEVA